jgi:hypothetical protein
MIRRFQMSNVSFHFPSTNNKSPYLENLVPLSLFPLASSRDGSSEERRDSFCQKRGDGTVVRKIPRKFAFRPPSQRNRECTHQFRFRNKRLGCIVAHRGSKELRREGEESRNESRSNGKLCGCRDDFKKFKLCLLDLDMASREEKVRSLVR